MAWGDRTTHQKGLITHMAVAKRLVEAGYEVYEI